MKKYMHINIYSNFKRWSIHSILIIVATCYINVHPVAQSTEEIQFRKRGTQGMHNLIYNRIKLPFDCDPSTFYYIDYKHLYRIYFT